MTSLNKKTIEDIDVSGKKVLVRCDFNVPLDNGVITDEKRIRESLKTIKYLVEKGENIVSTHALFQKFDNELIDMCRAQNYTLIMDEVANVIDEYNITKQDFEILKNTYVTINPETRQLIWKEEYSDYLISKKTALTSISP